MIEPTIGRVVWYYPKGKSQKALGEPPLAAIIAFVHSAECINIGLLNSIGVASSATGVALLQDGESEPDGPFCEWMPYQIGQAKKTEQAESVAEAAKRGFRS